jgi:hypothetical protein
MKIDAIIETEVGHVHTMIDVVVVAAIDQDHRVAVDHHIAIQENVVVDVVHNVTVVLLIVQMRNLIGNLVSNIDGKKLCMLAIYRMTQDGQI